MNRAGGPDRLCKLMRQLVFSLIRVRQGAAGRSHGLLLAGRHAIPVVLGRAGIAADKREGDGATPRGRFRLTRLWWRADRLPRPGTRLPVRRIDSALAWCEDPTDRRYNRPFRRSANEPGDRLWREDRLYDLVIELSHNTRPRVAGRGSAVFVHVARPDRSGTAGCVALDAKVLQHLVGRLGRRTQIDIA
jgi:L,D-peptidoglycan transpeptidase YkuD (ErfK/YbiS/YcfS/YnhG family)